MESKLLAIYTITVELTGVSASTSVGSVKSFPEQGWGSDSWGDETGERILLM